MMKTGGQIPNVESNLYSGVYNLVLACGNVHEPRSFAIEVLRNVGELCQFDAASVYFMSPNGAVEDQYLLNTDEYWSNVYLDYYSGIDDAKYSPNRAKSTRTTPWGLRDWRREQVTEFVSGLVRPRGLNYSLGFSLFDLHGHSRIMFSLDRMENKSFNGKELSALSMSIPMLNNLHQNFYYQRNSLAGKDGANRALMAEAKLTSRETEIANLICQGISPAEIGKTLYITQATVYKHIAHIYEKMKISSRQELMAKLLT